MKRKINPIILISCLGIIIIMAMFYHLNMDENKSNGFKRIFLKENPLLIGKIVLEKDYYSIIDILQDSVRLYEYKRPYNLTNIALDLRGLTRSHLKPLSNVDTFDGLNTVSFYGKNSYVISGMSATAYRISSSKKIEVTRVNTTPFYHSEVIYPNSLVFSDKVQLNGINRRELKKVNWKGIEIGHYLPEKEGDGYFSNDGQFKYDKGSNRLFYMFYYKGLFTCLDTNLKAVYNAKTIDTVQWANIQLKFIEEKNKGKIAGNSITQAKPPKLVNKRFCIDDGNVYIQSNLKADNEKNSLKDFDVIDVYKTNNGKYLLSFYLPKLKYKKLSEFKISHRNLVALYMNTVAIFRIPNFNATF